MSLKITTLLVTKIVLWIIFWSLLVMLSMPVMAQTNADTRTSRSISFKASNEIDAAVKDEMLNLVDADVLDSLVKDGFRAESLATGISVENSIYNHTGEIIIYDVVTELISDFNADGFYHRFSATIDADTIYDISYIYARLYLSYEGGPWNHYASSDAYHIYGDSEFDIFTIETELADGFPPGYYDIRIELYNADTDEWLLSYGPYDDASLYALPLEDAYYDDTYQDVLYPVETDIVVAGHGHGSLSWLLMLPFLHMPIRKLMYQGKRKEPGQ